MDEQLEGQYSIYEYSECKNCFHEDENKCWCRHSEYYEKCIPMMFCPWYDGVTGIGVTYEV